MTTEAAPTTVDTSAAQAQLELMGFVDGLFRFKTLAAAVELGLFAGLADGRQATREQIADEVGLPERPADMLLAACAALGLVERGDDGRYRNSAMAETVLVPDSPGYCGGIVTYFDSRGWRGWERLSDALRLDRPTTWDPTEQDSPFAAEDGEMLGLFWHAIHNHGRTTARALAQAYDFGGHQRLLDVGAGSGCYPIELCRAHPHLTATAYDLPHVVPLTQEKIDEAGMSAQIATVPGDFFVDEELPQGHDVLLLGAVLHDWDEATNRMLLAKCRRALPPGGVLLICEFLLDEDRTGPPPAALMGLNMIVETVGGRNYAVGEYREWLLDAGFREVTTLPFASPGEDVIVARA